MKTFVREDSFITLQNPLLDFEKIQKQRTELFLQISQISQKNTRAWVSFLIKLQASGTGVLMWMLQNLQEQLFYRKSLGDCFLKFAIAFT